MATKLNRKGLAQLLARGYSQVSLAEEFALSREWVGQIIHKGREPRHPGVLDYVNAKIDDLLRASE